MPTLTHPMGSAPWVEQVFASPPVRKLKGHSKHTQYHQTYVEALGETMGAQGRTEGIALIALEYLTKQKIVRQFKGQPFQTNLAEFGTEIVPDFLVQGRAKNELFVLEMKTARFITRIVQSQLEKNREKFAPFGMKYVVWSDQDTLTHSVRHHLIDMRRFGLHVPCDEQERIAASVRTNGMATVRDLYQCGFDYGGILAAAWSGLVYFSLSDQFTDKTRLYTSPNEDLRSYFFHTSRNGDDWWSSLPQC